MAGGLCTARGNYRLDGGLKIENTLIYLTGFPASGKLTIAKLLCEETGAFLIDNHTINNPIIQLIRKSGDEILGEQVWTEIAKIRKIVLDATVTIGSPEANYVMTNVLINEKGDEKIFQQIINTAGRRKAKFVPIKLACKTNDLLQRVSNPDRKKHMKLTDAYKLERIIDKYTPLAFMHKNMLKIDTSKSSPEESVQKIIDHVRII